MHPDRIDPARPCAASPLAQSACAHPAHVVGLGAPLSVRIRLEPCERTALRRQIRNRVPAISQSDATVSEVASAPADAPPQAQAWREMLLQLDDPVNIRPGVVLWPTALAMPALRGALADALAAVADCAPADGELAALADALRTASTL